MLWAWPVVVLVLVVVVCSTAAGSEITPVVVVVVANLSIGLSIRCYYCLKGPHLDVTPTNWLLLHDTPICFVFYNCDKKQLLSC